MPRIPRPRDEPAGRDVPEDELRWAFTTVNAMVSPMRERDAALLVVLVGAGLRRAEAVGLDIADVDVRAGELRVRGKGGHARLVYVANRERAALAAWLRVRGDAAGPLLLAVTRHGRIVPGRLATASIYKRVRRLLGAHTTPHDLRRTFKPIHVGRSSCTTGSTSG